MSPPTPEDAAATAEPRAGAEAAPSALPAQAAPSEEAQPGAPGDPGWKWWHGVVGLFAVALAGGLVISVVYAAGEAIAGSTGAEVRPPLVIALAGLVQAAALVGTAALFAGLVRTPRPRDFGFRAAPFWPTLGWAAVGFAAFYVLQVVYVLVFQPQGEQSVARELGLDRGTTALIAGGLVVIVLAPIGEETFFRGFLYPALRNSFGRRFGTAAGIGAGSLTSALLFAGVHYTDPKTLPVLPVLAMLGVVFALVYERTRTLYPAIAMHAIVNTVAFATFAKQDDWIGVAYGLAVIAGCVLAPRIVRARAAARAAPAAA